MNLDGKRVGAGVAILVVVAVAVAWATGWLGGSSTQAPPTAAAQRPVPPVPGARARLAGPPCTVPTDVFGPPERMAEASPLPDGVSRWIMTGLIFRCADAGSFSVDIQTPPEMGVTATAALQLLVTGVRLWPENEATETKATGWNLASAPTIQVKDPSNSDPTKNVVTISWKADSSRITSYELAFLISFNQKPPGS